MPTRSKTLPATPDLTEEQRRVVRDYLQDRGDLIRALRIVRDDCQEAMDAVNNLGHPGSHHASGPLHTQYVMEVPGRSALVAERQQEIYTLDLPVDYKIAVLQGRVNSHLDVIEAPDAEQQVVIDAEAK